MPIVSWCPKGCYIANHHVWVPERNKEEEEEETPADFHLYLIGQHYHMATRWHQERLEN